MNTIVRTAVFDRWLARLRDVRGKAMIIKRIRPAKRCNLGDCKNVGCGVMEMRIHVGPCDRVYFARKGDLVYVLLCAGTKSRQQRDLMRARMMMRQFKLDSMMTKTKSLELAPFDASDYPDSEEVIAEYLALALEDPDPDAFLAAVSDVAKARGITQVAADAGLGRESLYKALRPGAQPRFDTVRRLLGALNVRLDVVAAGEEAVQSKAPE